MSTVRYHKLVRDRIPQIIEQDGRKCRVRRLSEAEYLLMLDEKLNEEMREYQQDKTLEELADVLEVVRAAALARGWSLEALEAARAKKEAVCGGFRERILLEGPTGNRPHFGINGNVQTGRTHIWDTSILKNTRA